jgi:SAM-dependent methyltransferase
MAVDIECYMPKEIMRTYGIVFAYADLDIPPTHFPVSPCFDLILASQVLEHLNFNPLPALQWFRDCLLPGGFLVLTTPDADRYPDIPDLPTARRMPWREIPEYDPGVPREHGHHSKQYTPEELNDLLTAAGFTLEPITRFEAQGGHLLAVGRC